MILSAIAAMSSNRVIGAGNKLPWHIPEDLKYFKEKTKNKILIMGRKTFESLGSRPLPNRFHIVVSRSPEFQSDHPLVAKANTVEEALKLAESKTVDYSSEVFVAGGGEIYTVFLPKLDRIYLTVIDKIVEGDAFFPDFKMTEFNLVSSDERRGDPGFSFKVFERRK